MCLKGERQQHVYATPERKKFLEEVDEEMDRQDAEDRGRRGAETLRPAATSSRRFDRSIRNFLLRYRRLGDSWMLFDNSGAEPTVMAFEKQGSLRIMHRELYDILIARYGKP